MTGNEVEIRVSVKNDARPGLASSRSDVEKWSADFDRLVTKSLQDGQTGFQTTTRRAEELRGELNRMRSDFARTGSAGIFGDIKKSEKDLTFLEDAIKAMAPRVEAEFAKMGDKAGGSGGKHAGDEFVKSVPYGIGSAAMGVGKAVVGLFEKIGPQVVKDALGLGEKAGRALADGVASTTDAAAQDVPQLFTPEGAIGAGILAAIVLTLAPAVAGALAAAVTLGVGTGIIGIGALIEKDNANLVAKAGQLGSDISDTMKAAASGLDEPFSRALSRIDAWVQQEGPAFKAIFDSVAPAIEPITQMVLGFVSDVTPGLRSLGQTFTEVFQDPQTQGAIDALGKDLNAFFETAARHKQTIIDVFSALVMIANTALGVLNALINAAAMMDVGFRILISPLQAIGDHFNRIDENSQWIAGTQQAVETLIPVVQTAALSYDDLSASMSKTSVTADTLAGQLTDKVMNGLLSADFAVLHFDESLTKVSEELAKNGNALDIHTAKGQADREAILSVVQANLAQYDSMIQAGMSAKDAAAQYDTNTTALEKQLRAAGLLQPQIDGIIGKYRKVPGKVNTLIAIEGLTKAIEDLDTTLRLINHLPTSKTFTLHVRTVGGLGPSVPSAGDPNWTPPQHPGRPGTSRPGGIAGRATGGIAGGLTWLGEYGAELARLPQGTTVYPHGQSMAMANQSGGGGQPSGPAQLVFAGDTDTAFAAFVQRMFRDGKIQLVAGGQRVKVG